MLARAGLLAPSRPDRLLGMALALVRWGVTPATGYAAGAARHPDRPALVDDDGVLTYREVDQRTTRIAAELRARGVGEGAAVGVLARNGRGFVEAMVSLAKCGADVLYLNTGWSGEQVAGVLEREKATALVRDAEFEAVAGVIDLTTEQLSAVSTTPGPRGPLRAARASRQVILTSGTTGVPRGAARSGASIEDAASMLSRLPLHTGGRTLIAAPVFHAWGLGHLSMAMLLGSTVVLHRRFDPDRVLRTIEAQQVDTLVVVPVMIDKLLAAHPERYHRSSLTVIASSGSALPAAMPAQVEKAFGPVLYSLYGSTEVAYAAVATPDDLRADPSTAGTAPHGVTLRVVDEAGTDVPPGETGRIFVGSGLSFAGYTDGSDKDRLDGLVATGDLGRLDAQGRLTVLGRDDDMVVVGGENVFTGAVENCLREHAGVTDAAVVGAPDEQYGSRLVAYVVGSAGEQDLQDHVRERLARFAVPREVHLVEELPRNATGKVVKRELGT
ncbi:MAG: acyl-CoA synthetase [Frankiales bacterium]|nr:acyl-CoA synthetase [Frankiales bacterium]